MRQLTRWCGKLQGCFFSCLFVAGRLVSGRLWRLVREGHEDRSWAAAPFVCVLPPAALCVWRPSGGAVLEGTPVDGPLAELGLSFFWRVVSVMVTASHWRLGKIFLWQGNFFRTGKWRIPSSA
ncbi:hypothetical protein BDB00DRAFT_245665 [Zychaea mexicana]|uniref:uncharacterized protein n=1 Tax=Zychaea mexicana TaxID=64656 RepID=UPI0022FE1E9E|nr:uncharacterized protein BDB00DRAFT_245665 [Zychaea mexicana]KAI9495379.1 hypothetical protein BDB00DRAFT_245665 [Zychaea mexicana]